LDEERATTGGGRNPFFGGELLGGETSKKGRKTERPQDQGGLNRKSRIKFEKGNIQPAKRKSQGAGGGKPHEKGGDGKKFYKEEERKSSSKERVHIVVNWGDAFLFGRFPFTGRSNKRLK